MKKITMTIQVVFGDKFELEPKEVTETFERHWGKGIDFKILKAEIKPFIEADQPQDKERAL